MGYQATGIDFAEQTVARVNAAAPELDVRCGDVRSLPFGDDTFAGYLSLGVIEHFWNGYGPILSEMRRVVRPGGYVFLSVPCMSLLRRAKAAAGMYPTTLPENPEKDFYQFALDRHRVLREVKRAGFHPVEVHRFGGIKGFKDEVRFGRNWLQRLHDGKTRFRFKNALDNQLARFANHMMFVVMRNTHKTRKRSKS